MNKPVQPVRGQRAVPTTRNNVPGAPVADRDVFGREEIEWMLLTGYVYLQNDHFDKAIALLEMVLSIDRNNFDALKQLCYAYLLSGRYRETLVVCEKLYDITVGHSVHIAPIYLIHSHALLHLNQKEQARDWLLKYQSFLGPELHV